MNKPNHLLTLFLIAVLIMSAGMAQAQQTVYYNGNVSIVQNHDGWQILLGTTVVGHGDGVLDVTNLPPAFKNMLDFYATQKESSLKKHSLKKIANTTTYGPLLTTSWSQTAPYNKKCPKFVFEKDGNQIEIPAALGSHTISTAQVLFYYGYCNDINVDENSANSSRKTNYLNTNDSYFQGGYSNLKFVPYYGDVEDHTGLDYELLNVSQFDESDKCFEYKAHFYNYTNIDFDKIASDNDELARFLVGVAFAQKASFGINYTSTSVADQVEALNGFSDFSFYGFGYNATGNVFNGSFTNENNVIITEIENLRPVIVSDKSNIGEEQSFVIDGYNPNNYLYHCNYGWGGTGDGWFSFSDMNPANFYIITACPSDQYFATLIKDVVQSVFIRNRDNNSVTNLQNNSVSDNEYKFETTQPLEKGTYEFYFQLGGGEIAPYQTQNQVIELTANNLTYRKRGAFQVPQNSFDQKTATFTLDDTYSLTFTYNFYKGEISIVARKPFCSIEGKVLDENGNPVKGAMVSKKEPEFVSECNTLEGDKNVSVKFKDQDVLFTNNYPYLSKVEFEIVKISDCYLTVSILDKRKNTIWQKENILPVPDENGTVVVTLDKPLKLTPDNYYLRLCAQKSDDFYYEWYQNSDGKFRYKIYVTGDYYVTTKEDGSYTYETGICPWTGKLSAFTPEKIFSTLKFYNLTTNQSDQDIHALIKFIRGQVLDADGQPVAGAKISTEDTPSENDPVSDEKGNYVYPICVDPSWSGTLHAYSGEKSFNTLTFNGVTNDLTYKNFQEGSSNVKYYSVTYKIDDQYYTSVGGLSEGDAIPAVDAPIVREGYYDFVFKSWESLPSVMPNKDITVNATWQKLIYHEGITITISSPKYTGEPQEPEITVSDLSSGNMTLGEDYVVSLPDNCIDAGDYPVTITGKGNYTGETTATFTITPVSVTLQAEENKSKQWTENDPEFTVSSNSDFPSIFFNYNISRQPGDKPGEYDIILKGPQKQGNFDVTFVNGKLTIKENALEIKDDGNGGKKATINANSGNCGLKLDHDIEGITSVEFNRDFTPGVFSTVIVPFDADLPDETFGTFYTFVGVDYNTEKGKWVASVERADKIQHNTPYIFEAKTGSLSWNVKHNDNKLYATSNETYSNKKGYWDFIGLYVNKSWSNSDYPDYGFAGEEADGVKIGDFVRAAKGASIDPFRCYLNYAYDGPDRRLRKAATVLPDVIEVYIIDHDATPSGNTEESSAEIITPVTNPAPASNLNAWSYNGTIYLQSQPGTEYQIIDLSGRVIHQGVTHNTREEVKLSKRIGGIVVVKIADKVFKINY